jgi:hypothetical protein
MAAKEQPIQHIKPTDAVKRMWGALDIARDNFAAGKGNEGSVGGIKVTVEGGPSKSWSVEKAGNIKINK